MSSAGAAAEGRPITLPQVEVARVGAMGAIFLFHLWSVVPDGAGEGWAGVALSQGYLGVVIFNLITGLVLAWPHLGPAARPAPALGEFLRRRFLRIVPAYWIALLVWTAVAALAREPPAPRAVVGHLLFVHTLSPALFFAIVPAYWWLGLLAQLYLAFLLVLRFQRAVGPWRGAAIVCAVCWAGWIVVDAAAAPGSTAALLSYMAYYNLPYRLPEFALGIALASSLRVDARRGTPRVALATWAGLLAATALVVIVPTALPDSPALAHARLVAACFAIFVTLLALPGVDRLGRMARARRLAAASYGFYLLHQPILGYGVDMLRPAFGDRVAFWVVLVGAGLIAFRLAVVLDRIAASFASRPAEKEGAPPRGGAPS